MTVLNKAKKIEIQTQLRQTGYFHIGRGSLWLISTAIKKA